MMSQASDLEAVVKRLERIEKLIEKRQNETHETSETNWWRMWGPLIYLLIGAALPIGLGVSNTMRSLGLGPGGQGDLGGQRVEAEEFALKDSSGRVRAKLVVGGNSPQLTLYDAAGNPGAPLVADPVIRRQVPATKSVTGDRDSPRLDLARPASDAPPSGPAPVPDVRRAESPPAQALTPTQTRPQVDIASAAPIETAATGSPPFDARLSHGPPDAAPIARPTRNPFTYSVPQRQTRPRTPPTTSPGLPAGANFAVQPQFDSSVSRVSFRPSGGSPNPVSPPVPGAAPAAPNPSALPVPAAALPPVNLTVLGYVEKPGVGREVAVSDNLEVYVTHEGETFAERFKVVKIAPTVVQVLDTYTNQTLQLALSP